MTHRMKKLIVTVTHELEVPDHCELVRGPDGTLLKLNHHYLCPGIEYSQSTTFSPKEMTFYELDEDVMDTIVGAVIRETKEIREI